MGRTRLIAILLCLFTSMPAFARHHRHRHYRRHHRHYRHRHRIAHRGLIILPSPQKNVDRAWSLSMGLRFRRANPTYGAFVALDAQTGRILAMAQYDRYRKSRFRPAFSARFPAASVFKIVSTSALLSTDKVFPWTRVCYHGGRASINWYILRHSRLDRHCRNLQQAFAHSTNAILAKLAVRFLSNTMIYKTAKLFGFNMRLGLPGLAVSRTHKPRGRLERARMAAGFIFSHISPIHAAVLAAIVANGGNMVYPHWDVRPGHATNNPQKYEKSHRRRGYRVISAKVAAELQKMMRETTARGTAAKYLSWVQRKGMVVGCKTGTLTGAGLKNSWMVCFVRTGNRDIAFSVLSANRYHYRKSGPVAITAVRYLLKKQSESSNKLSESANKKTRL